MCGRFTLTPQNVELVAARLGVDASEFIEESYTPRWNIAPMQPHWIVRLDREERHLLAATWGLVTPQTASKPRAAKPINVRAENIVNGAFRHAFAETRCAVPTDGFFEWIGEANTRRPFWFHRPDGDVFTFAGLYSEVELPDQPTPLTTFTIITTAPNAIVAPIHDRMPVILPDDEAIDEWLYPRQQPERLHGLMRPAPDDFLVVRAVSARVNSVRNDDPACLEEAESETQGPLL